MRAKASRSAFRRRSLRCRRASWESDFGLSGSGIAEVDLTNGIKTAGVKRIALQKAQQAEA